MIRKVHHVACRCIDAEQTVEWYVVGTTEVERLARVIATAEHVWDSVDDARAFLSTDHAMQGGKRPLEVALTELSARRVENLRWSLFHGVAA